MKKKNEKTALEKLLDSDFHYNCEYDYSTENHCEDYGCDDEGICRCSTMEDFHITEINFNSVVNKFVKNLTEDDFTAYCIERICNALKLWDINNWGHNIIHSYYGEEIEDIKIEAETQIELNKWINKVLKAKTNKDKLFVILELEYGYVLEELKEYQDWDIVSDIPLSVIVAGQTEHYTKLDKKIIKKYSDYKLPIGVCISKGDGSYRLIDGYHRFRAMNDKKISNVSIITNS
jgi:hypothetical protein